MKYDIVTKKEKELWKKLFNIFKNEDGEYVHDRKFLSLIKRLFIPERKSSSSEEEEEETDEEAAEHEAEPEQDDEEVKKRQEKRGVPIVEGGETEEKSREKKQKELHFSEPTFEEELVEFVDEARHYLLSRKTTLVNHDYPYRATQPKLWFYRNFHKYLEEHQFIDKMIAVLVKMFAMHPQLPEDPLMYIRDNFGTTMEMEKAIVKEWSKITSEVVTLKEEGKRLEEKITFLKRQLAEEEEEEEDNKEDERSKVSRTITQEKPSTLPSDSSGRLVTIDSEMSLVGAEETEEVATSSSDGYETVLQVLKTPTESYSSLDFDSQEESSQS